MRIVLRHAGKTAQKTEARFLLFEGGCDEIPCISNLARKLHWVRAVQPDASRADE